MQYRKKSDAVIDTSKIADTKPIETQTAWADAGMPKGSPGRNGTVHRVLGRHSRVWLPLLAVVLRAVRVPKV